MCRQLSLNSLPAARQRLSPTMSASPVTAGPPHRSRSARSTAGRIEAWPMPTTRHVVAVTEPVSNSITTVFNSYKLTFTDQHAFNQTFSGFRSRRRIIGTMSAGYVNGVWTEWIDFTVRDGPPWWDGVPDAVGDLWGSAV